MKHHWRWPERCCFFGVPIKESAMNTLVANLGAGLMAVGCLTALAGCESKVMKVPPDAPLVAQATGTMVYRPTSNGNVYIYDRTANRLVYSGYVHAGDDIRVDTFSNRVLVNGRVAAERLRLGAGNEFQVYMRGPMAVERRTIIEERRSVPVERRTVIEVR
jgi:hypothetical protein